MSGYVIPIILLVVGAIAFFLEVFIPSGGLISVVASACLVAAVVLAFRINQTAGIVSILAVLVIVPTTLVLSFTLFPKTPIGRLLTLRSQQSQDTGFVAQDLRERELLGKTGVALSALRPSGEAKIGDRRIDVMTEGEMIEKGADIVVRRVEGNRIVVRRIPGGQA